VKRRNFRIWATDENNKMKCHKVCHMRRK